MYADDVSSQACRASQVLLAALPLNSIVWTSLSRLQVMSPRMAALCTAIVSAVIMLRLAVGGRRYGHRCMLDATMSLFLTIVLATLLVSTAVATTAPSAVDSVAVWSWTLGALLPAGYFFAIRKCAACERALQAFHFGLQASGLVCVSSVALEFAGVTEFEHYGNRYFGFVGDSAAWVLSLVLASQLSAGKFGFALSLLTVGALALTGSRTATAIALLSLAVMAFALRSVRLRLVWGVVGVIIAVAVSGPQVPALFSRWRSESLDGTDRIRTWERSLEIFAESPMIGSGFHAQRRAHEAIDTFDPGTDPWPTPASTLAQLLADGGLVAAGGFVGFVVCVAVRVRSQLRNGWANHREFFAGEAVWVVSFLSLNHTAAWLLPGSILSPIIFATVGFLAGPRSGSEVCGTASDRCGVRPDDVYGAARCAGPCGARTDACSVPSQRGAAGALFDGEG
jgi:hypothetical protein